MIAFSAGKKAINGKKIYFDILLVCLLSVCKNIRYLYTHASIHS